MTHTPVAVFILITWAAYTHRFTAYLYFHGHLPAILHPRQVNLTDGRRCKWTLLKRFQLVSPVGTQVAVQRFLQTDTNSWYFRSLAYSTQFIVIKNCSAKHLQKRPLLSFVWLAWSQHSVLHAQRSWQVEGWWTRHLKCRNTPLCYSKRLILLGSYEYDTSWHYRQQEESLYQTLLSVSK